MANLKCKICGGEIEELECCEMEVQEDRIILEKFGACKECQQPHLWQEYFFYAKTTEPEPINVDDADPDLDLDEEWGDDGNLESGFDPYEGCYTYDC